MAGVEAGAGEPGGDRGKADPGEQARLLDAGDARRGEDEQHGGDAEHDRQGQRERPTEPNRASWSGPTWIPVSANARSSAERAACGRPPTNIQASPPSPRATGATAAAAATGTIQASIRLIGEYRLRGA